APRRVAYLHDQLPYVPEQALRHSVLAATYQAKGELDTARRLYEEAIAIAPTYASAHAQLAMIYDQEGSHDLAIEQYRRALELQQPPVRPEFIRVANSPALPLQIVALNNLAYDLAVHKNAPAEALPLAEKALRLLDHDPNLLDTLAWVEHLLGENGQ